MKTPYSPAFSFSAVALRPLRIIVALLLVCCGSCFVGALLPETAHGVATEPEKLAESDVVKINRIDFTDEQTLVPADITLTGVETPVEILQDKSLALKDGSVSIDEYIIPLTAETAPVLNVSARYRNVGRDRKNGKEVDAIVHLSGFYFLADSVVSQYPVSTPTVWKSDVNKDAKNKLTSQPNIRLSSVFTEGWWQVYVERVGAQISFEYSDTPDEAIPLDDVYLTFDKMALNYGVGYATKSSIRGWDDYEHVYTSQGTTLTRPGSWNGTTHFYPSQEDDINTFFYSPVRWDTQSASQLRHSTITYASPQKPKFYLSIFHDLGIRHTRISCATLGTASCSDPIVTALSPDTREPVAPSVGDRFVIEALIDVPRTAETSGTLPTIEITCDLPSECTVSDTRVLDGSGSEIAATVKRNADGTATYVIADPASYCGQTLCVESSVTLDDYPQGRTTLCPEYRLSYGPTSDFVQTKVASLPLAQPEIVVSKTVADRRAEYLVTQLHPGKESEITFEVTVTNAAEKTSSGSCELVENLPAGLSVIEDSFSFDGDVHPAVTFADGKPCISFSNLAGTQRFTYRYTCAIEEKLNGRHVGLPETLMRCAENENAGEGGDSDEAAGGDDGSTDASGTESVTPGFTVLFAPTDDNAFYVNDPVVSISKSVYVLPEDMKSYTENADVALQTVVSNATPGTVAYDVAIGENGVSQSYIPHHRVFVFRTDAQGAVTGEVTVASACISYDDDRQTWDWHMELPDLPANSRYVCTLLLNLGGSSSVSGLLGAVSGSVSNYTDDIVSPKAPLVQSTPDLDTLYGTGIDALVKRTPESPDDPNKGDGESGDDGFDDGQGGSADGGSPDDGNGDDGSGDGSGNSSDDDGNHGSGDGDDLADGKGDGSETGNGSGSDSDGAGSVEIPDEDNPLAGPGADDDAQGPHVPSVFIKRSDDLSIDISTDDYTPVRGALVPVTVNVEVTAEMLENLVVSATADDGLDFVADSVRVILNGTQIDVPFTITGNTLDIFAGTLREGDALELAFDMVVSLDAETGSTLNTEIEVFANGTDIVTDEMAVTVSSDNAVGSASGTRDGSGSSTGTSGTVDYSKPFVKTGDPLLETLHSWAAPAAVLAIVLAGAGCIVLIRYRNRIYQWDLLRRMRRHPQR